jgi:hypothetical protein
MRKRLTLIFAVGAAIAVTASAVAIAAKPTVVRAGNLILTLNGGVSPSTLPKKTLAPISLNVSGGISTSDGSQPPALKELIVDTDKNGTINVKGLPKCTAGKLQAESTAAAKKACPTSILGEGQTRVRVAFPESTPFEAKGPLVVFNGGEKGGTTTLFVQAYVSVPTPTAIVTTVKIKKENKGPYGLHSVATIPVIAGGSGSVTSFELTLNKKKQSYLEAKCPSGRFLAEADAVFTGGTSIKGQVIRPCKSKG